MHRSLIHGAIVTIYVGAEKKPFAIHKDLICQYSKYFNAAFNGRFEEAENKAANMDDVEPWVFAIFVSWLYTQQLDLDGDLNLNHADGGLICGCEGWRAKVKDEEYEFKNKDGKEMSKKELCKLSQTVKRMRAHPKDVAEVALVALAVLADRYDVLALRNAVVDTFHALFKERGKRFQKMCFDIFPDPQSWMHILMRYRNAYIDCKQTRTVAEPWSMGKSGKEPCWIDKRFYCQAFHDHNSGEEEKACSRALADG